MKKELKGRRMSISHLKYFVLTFLVLLLSRESTAQGKDLFIRIDANKENVYEQEAFVLSYKVYTLLDLSELNGEMPDLKGFHVHEIEQPLVKEFHKETINGTVYKCTTWSQYLMYPQAHGNLTIPPISFKGVVIKENKSTDPIDDFFKDRDRFEKVNVEFLSPRKTIKVKSLPPHPDEFSGGVGEFNISTSKYNVSAKSGEAITIRIIVSGLGNLKLIKAPKIKFPKDFESYDVKITDSTRFTVNGYAGSMIFDYPIVPINQGEYTIPSVKFIYFDAESESYKTVATKPIKITVGKGSGNMELNDIRMIEKGDSNSRPRSGFFFGSWQYFALLGGLFVLYFAVMIFLLKAKNNSRNLLSRTRKAKNISDRRLKEAEKYMIKGMSGKFYDEILHTLWGYISDKMGIPIDQLSSENIREKLKSIGVDENVQKNFLSAIEECEYERYAPSDVSENMKKSYDAAVSAIAAIEHAIKDGKKFKGHGKSLPIMLAVLVFAFIPANASTKAEADSLYSEGNYQQAIIVYNSLLKDSISPSVYYNLGNAYYRTKEIGKAIASYERARILAPNDSNINYNLQYAYSKTEDKVTPERETFFLIWFNALTNSTSIDNWTVIGICSLLLAMLFLSFYLLAKKKRRANLSMYLSIALFLIFAMSNLFAFQQKRELENSELVIVTDSKAEIRKSPDASSESISTVHEGRPLKIVNRGIHNWTEVQLEDGRKGWILESSLETI